MKFVLIKGIMRPLQLTLCSNKNWVFFVISMGNNEYSTVLTGPTRHTDGDRGDVNLAGVLK